MSTIKSLLSKQRVSEIDSMFEAISSGKAVPKKEALSAVKDYIVALDSGELKCATRSESGEWSANIVAKNAISIFFYSMSSQKISCGFSEYFDKDSLDVYYNSSKGVDFPSGTSGESSHEFGMKYFDKVPLKFAKWTKADFESSEFRVIPGAVVRFGSYVAKKAVLMPCFINIGAYVGEKTMIDTWSTVGSCAQIGSNCHISGGVGIAGVLEPAGANPVIIEDNVFIGARSEVAEGVIVREGSVLSMGVYLSQSTKIVDRETGNVSYGEIPPYSVVVPGSIESKNGVSLGCAVIVKRVDSVTRSKVSVNDLLR